MNIENEIKASQVSIKGLLKEQKFSIDYFQREYRWEKKHIESLIGDLTANFLKSYIPSDKRGKVESYQTYYLGPVVFSKKDDGTKSIIDGQQRITSLTLLLIYLNHLQNDSDQVSISELIFSKKYGSESFNMKDQSREHCLQALFRDGEYQKQENDDETVCNMVARYNDVKDSFPEEITRDSLPYFIDWLIEKVVLVEITTHSDDNAYMVFETMNDRGLNLTSTDMLKGFILSRIHNPKQRDEIDSTWKSKVGDLRKYNADQAFFQEWFRSKYAESIRQRKSKSEDKDYELIGTRFHHWFKDKHEALFGLRDSNDFYEFFKRDFPFFVKWYLKILGARKVFEKDMPHLYYIGHWGIAPSLQNMLLLASIKRGDNDDTVKSKLDFIARYIETYSVRRSVNFKKFAHSSIYYAIFLLTNKIRDNELSSLGEKISDEINSMEQKWDGIDSFGLHGQNRSFVKHLLSRISGYIDELAGNSLNYVDYQNPRNKNSEARNFEIEHVLGNSFKEYEGGGEFEHEVDFQAYRNSIGGLILLPNGTNQSFSNKPYEEKLEHYLKENIYAQTLHPKYYEQNPNFTKPVSIVKLDFKPHPDFKKQDIEERRELVKRICERLWSTDYFA